MGRKIRIGSRASRLAVVQSELVMAEIRKILPEADLELVTMKTTGDKILHKTLDKIGGKGLFLKELDAALLAGQVDICVHSLKDVPVTENPALPIGAYSVRELPADVLVFPKETSHPTGSAGFQCEVSLLLHAEQPAARALDGGMRHVEAAAFIDYADVKPVAGSLNAHGYDIRSGVLAGVRHGFLANAIGLRFQCAIEACRSVARRHHVCGAVDHQNILV